VRLVHHHRAEATPKKMAGPHRALTIHPHDRREIIARSDRPKRAPPNIAPAVPSGLSHQEPPLNETALYFIECVRVDSWFAMK
jgi:hypothetical protein